MSVETWTPPSEGPVLTPERLARLERAAAELDAPRFGLDAAEAGDLAPVARHSSDPAKGADWAQQGEELADDRVLALIRFFTLAEATLPGWEAGDASPVIPLAAVLKRRGSYPADLTAWIRANSDNRFLPYGNLMNRL